MIAQEIKIVEAESGREFTRVVNDLLSEGWGLSGGMSVVYDNNTHQTRFYQALVREYEQPGAWG
jgi:hypothetical protein